MIRTKFQIALFKPKESSSAERANYSRQQGTRSAVDHALYALSALRDSLKSSEKSS
jgi:hypothetical protein